MPFEKMINEMTAIKNILETVEVKGSDNMKKVLGAIGYLQGWIDTLKESIQEEAD